MRRSYRPSPGGAKFSKLHSATLRYVWKIQSTRCHDKSEICVLTRGTVYSPAPEALFSPVLELINKVERVVNNTDEQKVLNAKYVSWYKGKLVVKLPIDENAASFEVLFIGDKVNNIKTIQHEYGHTKQLDELGILKYSIYVAVPSVTCNLLTRAGKLPYGYYNSPWEYQADVYGGVNGRNYLPWANTVSEMYSTVTKFAPIPHYTH